MTSCPEAVSGKAYTKRLMTAWSRQRSYGSTQTIGHHHEQSLRTTAYADVRLLVDKQGTRDIEKVESHPVNQHGQDKQPHARPGIAQREEPETEHPCQHRYEHHPA